MAEMLGKVMAEERADEMVRWKELEMANPMD